MKHQNTVVSNTHTHTHTHTHTVVSIRTCKEKTIKKKKNSTQEQYTEKGIERGGENVGSGDSLCLDINPGSPASQQGCLGYLPGFVFVLCVKATLTAPVSLSRIVWLCQLAKKNRTHV